MVTRDGSGKIRELLCNSRTFDLPIASSDVLPLTTKLLEARGSKALTSSALLVLAFTYALKLLNADWLRRSPFFLYHGGTFGNQEGMVT